MIDCSARLPSEETSKGEAVSSPAQVGRFRLGAIYRSPSLRMLFAALIGVAIGLIVPGWSVTFNLLAVSFLNLIRLVVAPLIFVMMVLGIARLDDLRRIGRLALVSLIYFEAVTTVSFFWGLVVGNVLSPGSGLHIDRASLDSGQAAGLVDKAQQHHTFLDFILGIVPSNVVSPFLGNNIIQVLLLAVIVGCAITRLDERKDAVITCLEVAERGIFIVIGFIMRLAPLAVAGSTAFVIGHYGLATVVSLAKLIGTIYLGCLSLVAILFSLIAWFSGLNVWKLARYIGDELILTFATASGEAALPRLLIKVTKAGVPESVSGFVLPMGYSFNLDGGSINLIVCALFVGQAFDIHLSLADQLTFVAILALTSKGTAGVPGGGLVVFASSILIMPHLPLAGLTLVMGIDRFTDPMRSATNVMGNALATFAIAKWSGARDDAQMAAALNGAVDQQGPAIEDGLA